jgi:hypothetical protein
MKKLLVILMMLMATSVFAEKITANCVQVGAYNGINVIYHDSPSFYKFVYENGYLKEYLKKNDKWVSLTTGTVKYDGDSIINKERFDDGVMIEYFDLKTGEYIKTIRFVEGGKKGAFVYTGTCVVVRGK